ncbi:MAG: hypothetical protein ACRC1K_15570 [Planctomycetia bacterium]
MSMIHRWMLATAATVLLAGSASAEDWGRYYHYPYSYFPQNFRQSLNHAETPMPYGYPMYPQYQAFPAYFRKDLRYDYFMHNRPGGRRNQHYQGNHYILDVF